MEKVNMIPLTPNPLKGAEILLPPYPLKGQGVSRVRRVYFCDFNYSSPSQA